MGAGNALWSGLCFSAGTQDGCLTVEYQSPLLDFSSLLPAKPHFVLSLHKPTWLLVFHQGYLMNMLSCRTLGAFWGKQLKVRDIKMRREANIRE